MMIKLTVWTKRCEERTILATDFKPSLQLESPLRQLRSQTPDRACIITFDIVL